MSQPAPQEECAAEKIRQRAKIRYPKGVIYPITVHGMKGAMEDLAAAQLRAEQSENREEVLQLEFIDMRNRAKLAEKSALDFKAIADHLQRQRAESEAAHGRICDDKNKEIADLQARMTRYERLLEDAEGNAEAKDRADNTTSGKIITELQRENDRLRAVIDGIQTLVTLSE